MCNHDQQQQSIPAQAWMKLATDPEESITSVKHLITVLRLASQKPELMEEDQDAIGWGFHVLETLVWVLEGRVMGVKA